MVERDSFLLSVRTLVRLEMNIIISIGYDGLQTLYPSFTRERESRNAVRSVIDTGRQNGLSVFQAIRVTLDGNSIIMPA